MNNTPTEYEDQCALTEWMEWCGLKFTAIPNSTYTKSMNQKRRNTMSGLRAGFPDLAIIIPANKSLDKKSTLLFIELKREKQGVVSAAQKEWIAALKEAGQHAFIARGFDEAKDLISSYMK